MTKQRERFEAWVKTVGDGVFAGQFLNLMWKTWQAAEAQALESCAKRCDDYAVDRWNLYKGRAPYTGKEAGRAAPYVEGESDGAESCAEMIRAMMKE